MHPSICSRPSHIRLVKWIATAPPVFSDLMGYLFAVAKPLVFIRFGAVSGN